MTTGDDSAVQRDYYWAHSMSRVVVVVVVVVVVDIDFTLPFTRCRYCRTPPAL